MGRHEEIVKIHKATTELAVLADSDRNGPAEYAHDLAVACQEIAARIREIAGEETTPGEFAAAIYALATKICAFYERRGRDSKRGAA